MLCVYVQTHDKPLHSTFTLPDVLFLQFVVAFFFPSFNKCMLCTCVCALNFTPHSVVMVMQESSSGCYNNQIQHIAACVQLNWDKAYKKPDHGVHMHSFY